MNNNFMGVETIISPKVQISDVSSTGLKSALKARDNHRRGKSSRVSHNATNSTAMISSARGDGVSTPAGQVRSGFIDDNINIAVGDQHHHPQV